MLSEVKKYGAMKKDLLDNGIEMFPDEEHLTRWTVKMTGPKETPYEGGVFTLSFEAPQDYPFTPPKVTFVTNIYHINISSTGYICLNILKKDEAWTHLLSFPTIALSIISLLSDPNPDSALRGPLARLYHHDRDMYFQRVHEHTLKYAKNTEARTDRKDRKVEFESDDISGERLNINSQAV